MTESRGPGIVVPPPLLFVAGLLIGGALDTWVAHLWPPLGGMANIVDFIGGLLLGIGLALAVMAVSAFRRAKTTVQPNRDASALVVAGPYRFTRNPIYLGFTLAYIGIAILFAFGWALVLLPVVLVILHRFVIVREERYLTAAFGDVYLDYQRRVGRWW